MFIPDALLLSLLSVILLEACSLTKCRIKDPLTDTKACRSYLKEFVIVDELDALLKTHYTRGNETKSFI